MYIYERKARWRAGPDYLVWIVTVQRNDLVAHSAVLRLVPTWPQQVGQRPPLLRVHRPQFEPRRVARNHHLPRPAPPPLSRAQTGAQCSSTAAPCSPAAQPRRKADRDVGVGRGVRAGRGGRGAPARTASAQDRRPGERARWPSTAEQRRRAGGAKGQGPTCLGPHTSPEGEGGLAAGEPRPSKAEEKQKADGAWGFAGCAGAEWTLRL